MGNTWDTLTRATLVSSPIGPCAGNPSVIGCLSLVPPPNIIKFSRDYIRRLSGNIKYIPFFSPNISYYKYEMNIRHGHEYIDFFYYCKRT